MQFTYLHTRGITSPTGTTYEIYNDFGIASFKRVPTDYYEGIFYYRLIYPYACGKLGDYDFYYMTSTLPPFSFSDT